MFAFICSFSYQWGLAIFYCLFWILVRLLLIFIKLLQLDLYFFLSYQFEGDIHKGFKSFHQHALFFYQFHWFRSCNIKTLLILFTVFFFHFHYYELRHLGFGYYQWHRGFILTSTINSKGSWRNVYRFQVLEVLHTPYELSTIQIHIH